MADRETKGPNQSNWKRFSKVAALWALIILVSVMLAQLWNTEEVGQEIPFSQFRTELQRGNITAVTFIEGQSLDGTCKTPFTLAQGVTQVSNFRTQLQVRDSEKLLESLEVAGVTVDARTADRDWWGVVLGFRPWLLIIAFWIFIIRQMQ